MRVGGSGVAVQDREPGGADGDIGLSVAPGAPHGVGDDDADPDPEKGGKAGADRRGAAVRVHREQGEFGGVDIGAVHAGGGLDQPDGVLGDQGFALAGQYPHGLVVDELAAQGVPLLGVGGCADDTALGLGEHLAGDDHHVVIAQPGGGIGDRGGQIIAGPELAQPGHRDDLDGPGGSVLGAHSATPANCRPARTMSAVTAGSLISNGAWRTCTPSMVAESP